MLRTSIPALLLAAALAIAAPALSRAQVTDDQAARIRAAVPDRARAVPKKPRLVLIWNTPFMEKSPHKGYTIPHSEYAVQVLGRQTGAFKTQVSSDIAMLLPENIKSFDAIVLNNSDGPWIRPTEADIQRLQTHGSDPNRIEQLLRRSLLDYVRNGGGLVAFHYAIGANTHWPEFQQLLGAAYWGHPWNMEVAVRLDEPDHPLLAAFHKEDFRIADEIFQFREPYSRDTVRVLLSLDTKQTDMTVPWIHRKDNDFALAWIRPYGDGRVFYSAIGHRTEIWWNPAILSFYLDAIQFAAGDMQAPSAPLGNPR